MDAFPRILLIFMSGNLASKVSLYLAFHRVFLSMKMSYVSVYKAVLFECRYLYCTMEFDTGHIFLIVKRSILRSWLSGYSCQADTMTFQST